MWTVIKFNKKYFSLLKNQLKKKIGNDIIFYYPKTVYQFYKNCKITNKEVGLLDDYVLCFHKEFQKENAIKECSNTIGLQYFLKEHNTYQNEIIDFIEKCKNLENENGHISENIFDIKLNNNYKFFSGPFTNLIFKIIEIQKNKIKILIGNIETIVKKKEYCFKPI